MKCLIIKLLLLLLFIIIIIIIYLQVFRDGVFFKYQCNAENSSSFLIDIIKLFMKLLYLCVCVYIYVYICVCVCIYLYTGRFKMYSCITKIYYRKTVGHVFTKHVQIEGQLNIPTPSPQTLFLVVVHISATRRCEFM